MTRKELIRYGNDYYRDLVNACCGVEEKHKEFVRESIKALEQQPKILNTIDFAIDASNGDTNYFVGFRNGLRYAKSLIDGEEPQYESCTEQQPCYDAISCEAVIEWLKAKDIIKLSSQEETARKELKALPPVTPKSETVTEFADRCRECGKNEKRALDMEF